MPDPGRPDFPRPEAAYEEADFDDAATIAIDRDSLGWDPGDVPAVAQGPEPPTVTEPPQPSPESFGPPAPVAREYEPPTVAEPLQPSRESLPPPAPVAPRSSSALRRVAAAVVVMGLVAAAIMGLYFARLRPGTLIVTVSGPDSARLRQVRVLVDDQARCDALPCRVDGLAHGAHVVRIEASGYAPLSPQVVQVRSGSESVVALSLQPGGGQPERKPARRASAGAELDAVDVSDLPHVETEARGFAPGRVRSGGRLAQAESETDTSDEPEASPAAGVDTPEDTDPSAAEETGERASDVADGDEASDSEALPGTLRIVSNPPATAVLDGRPVGRTPTTVSVSPGRHLVLFIHESYGRRVVTVMVESGGSATAAVSFP